MAENVNYVSLFIMSGNEDSGDTTDAFNIYEMILPCTGSGASAANFGKQAGPITLILDCGGYDNTKLLDWWLQNNKINPLIGIYNLNIKEYKRKYELKEAVCVSYVESYNSGKYVGEGPMVTIVIEVDSVTIVGTEVSNV